MYCKDTCTVVLQFENLIFSIILVGKQIGPEPNQIQRFNTDLKGKLDSVLIQFRLQAILRR